VVIARKGEINTEQTRALEQHGKLIGRVKPAHRKCLEKGWWTEDWREEEGKREIRTFRVGEAGAGAGQRGGSGEGERDGRGASRQGGGHRLGKVLGSIPRPLNSEPEDIFASASKRPILRHRKGKRETRWERG
jgi:hypothetical protein